MKRIKKAIKQLMAFDIKVPPDMDAMDAPVTFYRGSICLQYRKRGNRLFTVTATFGDHPLFRYVKVAWNQDFGVWDFQLVSGVTTELNYTDMKYWKMNAKVKKIIDWLLDQVEQEEYKKYRLSIIKAMTEEVRAFKKNGSIHTIFQAIDEFEKTKDRVEDVEETTTEPLEDAAW